jgi:hypothetical protein
MNTKLSSQPPLLPIEIFLTGSENDWLFIKLGSLWHRHLGMRYPGTRKRRPITRAGQCSYLAIRISHRLRINPLLLRNPRRRFAGQPVTVGDIGRAPTQFNATGCNSCSWLATLTSKYRYVKCSSVLRSTLSILYLHCFK